MKRFSYFIRTSSSRGAVSAKIEFNHCSIVHICQTVKLNITTDGLTQIKNRYKTVRVSALKDFTIHSRSNGLFGA